MYLLAALDQLNLSDDGKTRSRRQNCMIFSSVWRSPRRFKAESFETLEASSIDLHTNDDWSYSNMHRLSEADRQRFGKLVEMACLWLPPCRLRCVTIQFGQPMVQDLPFSPWSFSIQSASRLRAIKIYHFRRHLLSLIPSRLFLLYSDSKQVLTSPYRSIHAILGHKMGIHDQDMVITQLQKA